MGWEERRGKRYYYRKRRIGGRVISEYVGSGEAAEVAAAQDNAARTQRAASRALLANEQIQYEAMNQVVAQFQAAVRTQVRAQLETQGYHQHKGQWRRKR